MTSQSEREDNLVVSQTVLVKMNDSSDWLKGDIAKFDDDTRRRRTSKRVRFSTEPLLIYRDDTHDGGELSLTPAVPVTASSATKDGGELTLTPAVPATASSATTGGCVATRDTQQSNGGDNETFGSSHKQTGSLSKIVDYRADIDSRQ